jgi:hypothetical protein
MVGPDSILFRSKRSIVESRLGKPLAVVLRATSGTHEEGFAALAASDTSAIDTGGGAVGATSCTLP